LTEPVWFYLRGEEYSMQIDHFARCIKDRNNPQVSSFESALQTDFVLSKMIEDTSSVRTIDDTRAASSPAQHTNFLKRRIPASFKSMFRRTQI
jgi:hypothetical protein